MSTIALNMIVGSGEGEILDRCLTTFAAKESFDETVIVDTQNDPALVGIAEKHGAKLIHKDWTDELHPFGDFAGARNFALDNSTSDYIFWLDSDDVLLDKYVAQWGELLKVVRDDANSGIEMYAMPYNIICDVNLNPVASFKRERIFKRTICRWGGAVHELMYPEWNQVKNAEFANIAITHLPIKPQYVSALRNIAILEHEVKGGNNSIQTRYFLARDLLLTNNVQKSLDIFNDIIDNMETSYEMMYAIAMELVWYFAYNKYPVKTKLNDYIKSNHEKVESWIRLALSFCTDGAEPYVVLGDTYMIRGNISAAEKMYRTALKKKLGAVKLQAHPFYDEVPNSRLSLIYGSVGENERALYHNRQCLKNDPKNVEYLRYRQFILKNIIEDFNTLTGEDKNANGADERQEGN